MPTFDFHARFMREYEGLSRAQREAFDQARKEFFADLLTGRFRASLRVKGVRGARGVFEMTWAPDGRATFEMAASVREGHAHIIWRRIGSHDIFSDP